MFKEKVSPWYILEGVVEEYLAMEKCGNEAVVGRCACVYIIFTSLYPLRCSYM